LFSESEHAATARAAFIAAASECSLLPRSTTHRNFFGFAKQNAACLRRQEKRYTDFAAGECPLLPRSTTHRNFFGFAKQNAACLRRQEKRYMDFAYGECPLPLGVRFKPGL